MSRADINASFGINVFCEEACPERPLRPPVSLSCWEAVLVLGGVLNKPIAAANGPRTPERFPLPRPAVGEYWRSSLAQMAALSICLRCPRLAQCRSGAALGSRQSGKQHRYGGPPKCALSESASCCPRIRPCTPQVASQTSPMRLRMGPAPPRFSSPAARIGRVLA